MSCYGPLAQWYDQLTGDVPYGEFADFYEREFAKCRGDFHLILDLCCGTGTLTRMMAQRGYEMIGVDASVEMLMQAGEKSQGLDTPPLYLCQDASELDLYGTVDAAYCSLDGMNYIPPEDMPQLMRKLRLFIRPGGLFIFDLRSPDWLRSMDGQIYVDEQEDVLCLWRADLVEGEGLIVYGMDIFSEEGGLWRREREEHEEFIHQFDFLKAAMEKEGFRDIKLCPDGPQTGLGRQFITAIRGE
ncbi:MAG: class I SAM-dependent methyltransferase [Oscillospiraceae bacterium]|nr:class I SAM-dependent methyltransferase [Oscillospiraceae bacterium]